MSLYTRPGSPFWWMDIVPPDGSKRQQRSTKIRHDAPTPQLRAENKRLADLKYHEAYTAAVRRRDGVDLPLASDHTFGDFAAWYLAHVTTHKRGHEREREIITGLTAAFGPLPLVSVTKDVVQEWMTVRRAKVKAITVNRETDVLKAMLAAAVPKYLKASPIARMKRLRVEKRSLTVLSRADEAKIAAAMTPADRAVLIAALDTLQRASDLLRLEWKHDKGGHLEFIDTKTGRDTKVPISKRLRQALNALRGRKKKTGPIFSHRRRGKTPRTWSNSLKQMLEDACTRAGVPYGRTREAITFHGLRHTGATRMIEAGVSLRVVQAIGGWSDLRQLTRYTHPGEQVLKDAVEAVG